MFSCKFCETIKNIFFTEHLRPAASRKWEQKNVLFFKTLNENIENCYYDTCWLGLMKEMQLHK